LRQNLSQQQQQNKVKVRAPRLPPAFSASPTHQHANHNDGGEEGDEDGELGADGKDPFRSFGKAKVRLFCLFVCFCFPN